MNFDFDLNLIIPYEITKYNSDLRIIHPKNLRSEEDFAHQLNRDMKQKLGWIIDRIGEASSKAQGLKEIITSCRKLAFNDQHRIYLMKDPIANNGKGSVVGMLKVGEKHLFVHDYQGKTHEMSPLCILDFYVCDSQQRRGYGRRLFDCMLSMENARVEHLAIDKPSEKSVRFLKKHYRLANPIPQVNNFVVFSGFFDNRIESIRRNSRNGSGLLINRKYDAYSASPSMNRTDLTGPGIDNRNSNHRTGSLDSRYETINKNENQNIYNKTYSSANLNASNLTTKYEPISTSAFSSNNNNVITNKFMSHSAQPALASTNSQNSGGQPYMSTFSNYFNTSNTNFNSNSENSLNTNTPMSTTNNSNNPTYSSSNMHNSRSAQQISQNEPSNTNNVLKYEDYNQNKINSFFQKNFFQNKYDPFPSINPFYNLNNNNGSSSNNNGTNNNKVITSKPPLPNNQYSNSNYNKINNNNNNNNVDYSSKMSNLRNYTNPNLHDPFPSLTLIKTAPDLFSNQTYMDNKFRKTKLWF